MAITRKQLIQKYIDFFKSKNHKEIPNASLIPENDPTVLFTTAGMHPLVPYLLSQPHPCGKRLVNIQKCIRTGDIDEVGDSYHHTFFEMLGNWSLGDYWKPEAIKYSYEFLTKILKIKKQQISITCFKGQDKIPKDNESAKIWESLKIPKSKIKFLGKKDNFWGPAGKTGPCGPDTEMFVNNIEIWNDVFMQYNKTIDGNYKELKQKNVDTGMGVERTLAVLNNLNDGHLTDNYLTKCFFPIIKQIEKISKQDYVGYSDEIVDMRIIADHIKASVFILAEGIVPSNLEQGYVLRRLIRRAIRCGRRIRMKNFTTKVAEPVFEIYKDYEHLQKNKKFILEELEKEESRFLQTLEKGENLLMKIIKKVKPSAFGLPGKDKDKIDGKTTFLLYQSYGFPIELIEETIKQYDIKIDKKDYEKELKEHKQVSGAAITKGRFKSGLADASEQTKKLHTACHLLNQALREILKNPHIYQKGSNITPERLRFDFNYNNPLTDNEIKQVEDWVNYKIKQKIPVVCEFLPVKKAKQEGAHGIFDEKYGEKVSVYSIGNISKEICAGPHVSNTSELGKFKIIKQESVGAGVRRIKAVLE